MKTITLFFILIFTTPAFAGWNVEVEIDGVHYAEITFARTTCGSVNVGTIRLDNGYAIYEDLARGEYMVTPSTRRYTFKPERMIISIPRDANKTLIFEGTKGR